jgi:porin
MRAGSQLAIAGLLAMTAAGPAAAQERDLLREAVRIEAGLTVDVLYAGGGRGDAGLGLADLAFALDTAAAGWWRGGRFHLHLHQPFGDDPTTLVGDVQGTSNIEASDQGGVFEAWYEHALLDDRLQLLAGLHDFNADFYALEAAAPFLNSSFGIGPEIAQTGASLYPTAAPGLRLRWSAGGGAYGQLAGYDGVEGPEGARGPHDAQFGAIEIGFARPDGPLAFKLAVGGWSLDAAFLDPSEQEHRGDDGAYLVAETAWALPGASRRLAAFVQLGRARPDRSLVETYYGGGLVLEAPFPGRPHDLLGIAVAHAHPGDRAGLDAPVRTGETSLELTYALRVNALLTLQPDLQYVHEPGLERGEDVLVYGLRLLLAY